MIPASGLLWPIAVLFPPLAGAIATTTPGSLAKEVAFLALLISLRVASFAWLALLGYLAFHSKLCFASFARFVLLR